MDATLLEYMLFPGKNLPFRHSMSSSFFIRSPEPTGEYVHQSIKTEPNNLYLYRCIHKYWYWASAASGKDCTARTFLPHKMLIYSTQPFLYINFKNKRLIGQLLSYSASVSALILERDSWHPMSMPRGPPDKWVRSSILCPPLMSPLFLRSHQTGN